MGKGRADSAQDDVRGVTAVIGRLKRNEVSLAPTRQAGREVQKEMGMEKRYLDIKELSGYIGLSRWSIYKLVNQRNLPHIPITKRTFRFDRVEIDKWMKEQNTKPKGRAF